MVDYEGFVTGGKEAFFVEDAVVWEELFMVFADNVTLVKDDGAVVFFAVSKDGCTDDDEGFRGKFFLEAVELVLAVGAKMVFEDEVFGGIAGESEFGGDDELGSLLRGLAGLVENEVGVVLEGAEGGVNLKEGAVHGWLLAAVVGGFFGDLDVVCVSFDGTCTGDADKFAGLF